MIHGIREGACAIFNTVPAPGMGSFISNCYLAGAAGIPVWHGSGHELGILDAAMLQFLRGRRHEQSGAFKAPIARCRATS